MDKRKKKSSKSELHVKAQLGNYFIGWKTNAISISL